MPVVILAPQDDMLDKLKSNMEEVQAREVVSCLYLQMRTAAFLQIKSVSMVYVPQVSALLAPIVYSIPVQLLSYHVAVCGTDVDQPRNLAKSVTVE